MLDKLKLFLFVFATLIFINVNATVVIITPHPDDAEASCGGLIANSVQKGEKVVIITMTGGEYGIGGKSEKQAREIRTQEAINAAKILGAEIIFFGAIDGSLVCNKSNIEKLKNILSELKPRIVTAPWAMDVHPDHQSTGMLAWNVFQDKNYDFELYFYETTNSPHTKTFQFVPTHYIDISNVMEIKKQAVLQHKSQDSSFWYPMYETLAIFRGYEADIPFAEAYIKAQNSSGLGGKSNVVTNTF